MVLLSDARRGLRPHMLAYWTLGLGIAATLTVNVLSGLAYGLVGVAVAAWPAVALVLAYESLMLIVRRSAWPAPKADAPVPEPPPELNGRGHEAVELFSADLAAGKVPGVRRIRREMRVGQPRAQQVREYLAALSGASSLGDRVSRR
jgi:hypothetical protein